MDKKVLTIGPDHKVLKGGIASVLSVYAAYDESFYFLPTYSSENNAINMLVFPIKFFHIFWVLLIDRNLKIVHIHGASRKSFARKYLFFLMSKYVMRRKIVYHVHGAEYHMFVQESGTLVRKMIQHMVEHSDALICLSSQWKAFFLESFSIKNIYVLNNTIPLPGDKQELEVYPEVKTFLLLGKIGHRKGVFDLIEVVKKYKQDFIGKAKFIIGGDGDVEHLKNEINAHDLSSIVEFVGWVSGEKKTALLGQCDVYLLPSYNEGLPISILEAMSYKMPIISTKVGGIPTIVKPMHNGILIEPGDHDALYESIVFFIQNQEAIRIYGEASYGMVQEFLPKKVINVLHDIYDEVVKA